MESKKITNLINSLAESSIVKWVTLAIAVLIFGLFAYGRFIRPVTSVLYTNELGTVEAFGYIHFETSAIQEFTFDQDFYIVNIEVQFANYAWRHSNENQVYIYFNDILIHEQVIHTYDVIDTAYYPLDDINIHVSDGDAMHIVITSADGIIEGAIIVWIRHGVDRGNRLVRYNFATNTYEELRGEISMRILGEEMMPLRILSEALDVSAVWIYIIFGGIMILTILSFFLMVKNDNGTPSSNQDSQEGT